jgi:DNA-binding FadR family transcriptional regulator
LTPPRNLTGELVRRLTEEITGGRFAPNEQLPTEQDMIASFGVSRTVVREAIAALKAEGLVEARQGAGIFVATNPQRPFRIDPLGIRCVRDVLELMELRMSVEVESAGLAANRRTAAQMRAIRQTLQDFKRAIRADEAAVDADFEFHCAVGAATNNHFYLSFLRYLGSFSIPRHSIHGDDGNVRERRAYLEGVLAEHRAVADAINEKDSDTAREAMRLHLKRGHDHYRDLDPDLPVG